MQSLPHLELLRDAEIAHIVPYLPPGARVLEIGAGTGAQARALARRGFAVTAIEVPSSEYAAHRLFPIIEYDGRAIPLPDRAFDVVFSSNVLEHVEALAPLHAEIRRVLAPGGFCLHVLPTHTWRLWTTLVSYPEAARYMVAALPRMTRDWRAVLRHAAGLCYVRRHGARGPMLAELWRFHPAWWRRHFRAAGFDIVDEAPMGLFYTGEVLLGTHLRLDMRARLARRLGSSCHLYKLVPRG